MTEEPNLITRRDLPLVLADRLDPSVRTAYRELWQEAQAGQIRAG